MMEKLSITLPSNMVSAIKNQIQHGKYASTSEVLRAAMRTWMLEEEENEARLASIKARVKRSLEDPRENLTSKQARSQIDGIFATHQTK